MSQPSLTIKYCFKKDKTKCSHTPWRSSKYARLVLVKTKNRTLKFEGEVLLFCWDFLMSCSSRRIKLFMIQSLKSDAPWASPLSTTRGNSFRAKNELERQLIFRELFKGNLPPMLSLYQHSVNIAELLFWCQSPQPHPFKIQKTRSISKNYTYPLLYGLEMIFEEPQTQNDMTD